MSRRALALAALLVAAAGCERSAPADAAPSIAGRWQQIEQPREWFEFSRDGTFRGRSYTGTEVAGEYTQQGAKVTLEVIPEGHGATLTLQDSILVMEEGTRYRRAAP